MCIYIYVQGTVERALDPTVRLRVQGESSSPKTAKAGFSGRWSVSRKIVVLG